MTKAARSALFGIWLAVTVTCVFCSVDAHSFDADCKDEKRLDLASIGAKLEFDVQPKLWIHGNYNVVVDGYLGIEWEKCIASNIATSVEFWIDLGGFYAVERVVMKGRLIYTEGAEIFVGNSNTSSGIEHKCGSSYPPNITVHSTSPITFQCASTHQARYVLVRKAKDSGRFSLQICEIEVYGNGKQIHVLVCKENNVSRFC